MNKEKLLGWDQLDLFIKRHKTDKNLAFPQAMGF